MGRASQPFWLAGSGDSSSCRETEPQAPLQPERPGTRRVPWVCEATRATPSRGIAPEMGPEREAAVDWREAIEPYPRGL